MKTKPRYFEYFTQCADQYCDWKWVEEEDLSWIDELNQRIKTERENTTGNTAACSLEELSKDFDSSDFPDYHEFPEIFREKYDKTLIKSRLLISEIIKSARTVKIEEVTLYVECSDGNHYFSTPHFGDGNVEMAVLGEHSDFDSIDTAVYAFINDWKNWNDENGQEWRKMELLTFFEALREPVGIIETGCEHEDLASLGYKHDTVVECPFCKQHAYVW